MVWAWLGGDADGVGLVRMRRRWCGPGWGETQMVWAWLG